MLGEAALAMGCAQPQVGLLLGPPGLLRAPFQALGTRSEHARWLTPALFGAA